MSKTLRPMTLGEILDRTFQIYRSRFFVFVGIAALPALAMLGIHFVDTAWIHASSFHHPYRQRGALLWRLFVSHVFAHFAAFFGLLILPAYATLVSSLIRVEPCSLRDSLKAVYSRWRSYLWVTVLKLFVGLIIPELLALGLLLPLIYIADAAGAFDGESVFLGAAVVVATVAFGFGAFSFLGNSIALTLPVATLEIRTGSAALRRSWELSKRNRKRIFAMWLIIVIIDFVVIFGVQFFARFALLAIFRRPTSGAYLQLMNLVTAVISSGLGPIYPIALTLIYYDQRIRSEGYDIEWMMNAAGLNPPVPVAAEEGALTFASTQTLVAKSLEGPLP